MSGTEFRVDAAPYTRMTKQLKQRAVRNTAELGRQIGDEFVRAAKEYAPWTDHRGVARGGMSSKVTGTDDVIVIVLGASAPNYKRGPHSAKDYMEYLEFDHDGEFAVIRPVFHQIMPMVRAVFPQVATTRVKLIDGFHRDSARARIRAARSRARRRGRA